MGTVIFPDAICKVFLDATIDERARRRANEFSGAAESADIELVKAEIEARDSNDRKRETAPLRAAPDAHRLDTTTMTIDEVVDAIVELVREATSDG